jgi:hypothetical protein
LRHNLTPDSNLSLGVFSEENVPGASNKKTATAIYRIPAHCLLILPAGLMIFGVW